MSSLRSGPQPFRQSPASSATISNEDSELRESNEVKVEVKAAEVDSVKIFKSQGKAKASGSGASAKKGSVGAGDASSSISSSISQPSSSAAGFIGPRLASTIQGLLFAPSASAPNPKKPKTPPSSSLSPTEEEVETQSESESKSEKMSGSAGSSSVVTSQPQPQNLASASASTASSLLYTGAGGGSGTTGNLLSGYSSSSSSSATDKTRWDDSNRQKSSSLQGRYSSGTSGVGMTNGTGSSNTITSAANGTANGGTSLLLNNSHSHSGSSSTSGVYSNGSSLTGTGISGVGGVGSYSSAKSGNYRLASLDRLAQRQKLYEHQQNGQLGPENLQSKRELFFKNESSPAPALVTSINSTPSGTTGGGGGGSVNNMNNVQTNSSLQQAKDLNSKMDGIRSHSHPHPHHTNYHLQQEDNRERESKENKMKMEMQEKDKRKKVLDGYVGFANLPNQVYRKAVKKGFDFTLMVVGESGLGKSTLINSMFLADIYSSEYPGPSSRIKKTVQVETCKVLLKENGVNLTLTIVDTPGFGDSIDNSQCWQPVMDYIENRYEDFLNAESRVNRKAVLDSRVHCCLYFIAPSGHGMKALDIELMKKLHDKVNIIPVIAKADTLTPEECAHFKKQILNEIAQNKIKVYEFPDCDDEEENKINKMMRERVPFAVVGSNTVLEVDGKKLRGRKYPWGTVIVENLEHCDFVALRNMVVRTHLQDLKDVTNNVHYENFRCRKLAGLGPDGKPVKGFDKNPLAQMEEEKKNHETKMKKMEVEMEQVFELKVKERTQRITDSEKDLKRREEQMRSTLEKLRLEFDDKKKHFESEKLAFEQTNGMTFDELRRRNLEALSKEAVDGKKAKKKGIF